MGPGAASDDIRWWVAFVRDVNGIDLLTHPAHAAPPEQVFSWERTS